MHELALLNIARTAHPLDAPEMADFVANIERINALAHGSPGFVWHLKENDAEVRSLFGDDIVVNVSVWAALEDMHAYVYRSRHADFIGRRKEWFLHMKEAYVVLWWVPAGHRPNLAEAADRLAKLRADGPTAAAFTFKMPFPAPPDTGNPPA